MRSFLDNDASMLLGSYGTARGCAAGRDQEFRKARARCGQTAADPSARGLGWLLALGGGAAAVAAAVVSPPEAQSAAGQVWPAFVLVAGLLLVGLVAHEDGLFAWGGHTLARLAPNGLVLFVGTTVLIVVVTTLLNLDTAVTFLTPVLVYAARTRGESEAPLLYASILLANAGSLLLPGSNLTNVIVLGHLHLSGHAFFDHMALAGLAAALVTAARGRRGPSPAAPHHRADRRSRPRGRSSEWAWWPWSPSPCWCSSCALPQCRSPRWGSSQ